MALTPRSEFHWYSRDGTPQHEIPMTTDPGRTRPVNLRDARKLKLLPSVTTILREINKEFLNTWKLEQAIIAAIANPVPLPGETSEQHILRIERAANSIVDEAAKRGTLIHEAIERFVVYNEVTADPVIRPLVEPYFAWHRENVVRICYAEKTCVHPMGYAGRLDLKAELRGRGVCIIDFKSRKRGADGKMAVYSENGEQLRAYREADAIHNPRADREVTVVINSSDPDIHIHEWPTEDSDAYWEAFQCLFRRWTILKKYNPAQI